jgi:hypothetical protein
MASDDSEDGVLPTENVTTEETVVLVRSLLVDWKVLKHLHEQGVVKDRPALRSDEGCCKPDGGTCCVNAKPSVLGL